MYRHKPSRYVVLDNESATTVHLYGYVHKLSLLSAKGSLTLLLAVTGNGLPQAIMLHLLNKRKCRANLAPVNYEPWE